MRPPASPEPSRTPDFEQLTEPLDGVAGSPDDIDERGDPDRDVPELAADGTDDRHDVHDIHDVQEDSDSDDRHDVHDIQDDTDSDEDSDSDDDSDSDESSDEGSEDDDIHTDSGEGSEDDDDIHTDSGEGDDSDSDEEGDDSDDEGDDSDDDGGTYGGGDGSDSDDDGDRDRDPDDTAGDETGDSDTKGDSSFADTPEQPDIVRSRVPDDRPGRPTQFGKADLRVGVIGCGERARTRHLPHLSSLPAVSIVAIADRSRERLEHVGDRYGVSDRYQPGSTLITEHLADLDGVVITTPPHTHADLAAQALEAGVATFVEPPLAVCPDHASTLVEQAERVDVTAMVGYPSRYDPAYHQFTSVLERSGSVRAVDACDVTPETPRNVRSLDDPAPGSPPPDVAAQGAQVRTVQAKAALGTDADWIAAEYLYQLRELCHDVNLLRGFAGEVTEIPHASLGGPGEFLTAELGHEGGIACHLTSGRIDGVWYEESVRVHTADSVVRLDRVEPSQSHSPSAVTSRDGTDGVVTRTPVPATEQPATRALGSFLEAIRTGKPTQTPFSDAARDVELIADLVHRGTTGGSR